MAEDLQQPGEHIIGMAEHRFANELWMHYHDAVQAVTKKHIPTKVYKKGQPAVYNAGNQEADEEEIFKMKSAQQNPDLSTSKYRNTIIVLSSSRRLRTRSNESWDRHTAYM